MCSRRRLECCRFTLFSTATTEWEQWLGFFFTGIVEVSQQATDTAPRILSLRERHRQIITDSFGRAAGNGHRVLEYLYQHPIVAVTEVRDLIQTSYPASNNLVTQFVTHGVLREMTGQRRNRRFVYREYVDLFYETDAGSTPP